MPLYGEAFCLWALMRSQRPSTACGVCLRSVKILGEHMRMPADEFLGDGLNDVAEIERPLFLRHPGMKYDLQEEIAEFFARSVKSPRAMASATS